MMKPLLFTVFCFALTSVAAQTHSDSTRKSNADTDSLYITQVEDSREPDKVLHAEPLYIDLIRDLGARKGEAEWNIGLGLTDKASVDEYKLLVEYEFAPIHRLGVEVEVPVTLYSRNDSAENPVPSNRIESLKAAVQWSFFVSEAIQTSLAVGYINEFVFSDLEAFPKAPLFQGNLYNPFVVAAKRWGNSFHSLLYAGAKIEQLFADNQFADTVFEANTSLHYMITGTRNFVGVEFNKEFSTKGFDMVIRPQMRLGISENALLGIAVGVPVSRTSERLGAFLRLIYEPGH